MSADGRADRPLTFTRDVPDVDDAPDRYGYPFEWRNREFRPVPTSWLIHGTVPPVTGQILWIAASAAFDPRLDKVVVRYAPADQGVDEVRVQRFDPAGPPNAQYPKPLEGERWRAVLSPSSLRPRIDTVRLGEREYVHDLVQAATGGEGRV